MAVRHQVIERPPEDVWAVLCDGSKYSDWVVGTTDSYEREGTWPEVGSSIRYVVGLGPARFEGSTVVRRMERPRWLELEAKSGWAGSARIAIEVRPWGAGTLVIVDEHPLHGPGGRLHNTAFEAVIQLRHRRMLRKLAGVVEERPRREPVAPAVAGPV
ncbi:SRPBCC family protein [Streptomyces sp. GC420]|uniref:SRPBCC family protein n=1 Tax=Streptomyces sp. GC420 TaxID=2697568 RepID=UPI001414F856|nr:SRPBCC family protein [Streptomyces sp. GC420]NBM20769.1 SRPBCC family protein [Streptomyces sp. GC420]